VFNFRSVHFTQENTPIITYVLCVKTGRTCMDINAGQDSSFEFSSRTRTLGEPVVSFFPSEAVLFVFSDQKAVPILVPLVISCTLS